MKLHRLIPLAGLLLALMLAPISLADGDGYATVLLRDGAYGVTFLGVTHNEDGSTTWSYLVEERQSGKGFKDLSNWALELDECVVVLDAEPSSYELGRNPHTDLYGIKWEVGTDFESGVFSITVEGEPAQADVGVAIKAGPKTDVSWIVGPACGDPEGPVEGPLED